MVMVSGDVDMEWNGVKRRRLQQQTYFCASFVFSSRWANHEHTLTFELVHISSD